MKYYSISMRFAGIVLVFMTAVAISFLPPAVWDSAELTATYTDFDFKVFKVTSTIASISGCTMLVAYFNKITKD